MTKVILIGTGTPNPDPFRAGPCVAVYYNKKVYLFDCGTGLVRNLNQIAEKLDGFNISQLEHVFITHLHSDHTLGLSDLIITPWILGRKKPLKVYGPRGTKEMVDHLLSAYQIDFDERINGFEKANHTGCEVVVHPLMSGQVYHQDIQVEAFLVNHGHFEAYGFKVTTPDKTIVISGDTAPSDLLISHAKACDILIHEVYFTKGLKTRSPKWQVYHSTMHTSAIELGKLASLVQPKTLVLYHQLFMQETILDDDMSKNNILYRENILNEVRLKYNGNIVYGDDLMIIE